MTFTHGPTDSEKKQKSLKKLVNQAGIAGSILLLIGALLLSFEIAIQLGAVSLFFGILALLFFMVGITQPNGNK